MKDEASVLEGDRLGQHMLPNMPRARSRAAEDHNLRLGGADGEFKGLAKALHAIQKGLELRGRPCSSKTSSAYTREDTHLSEPSWTPGRGAALT